MTRNKLKSSGVVMRNRVIVSMKEIKETVSIVTINKTMSMMEVLIQQVKVVSKMIAMKLIRTMNLKRKRNKTVKNLRVIA